MQRTLNGDNSSVGLENVNSHCKEHVNSLECEGMRRKVRTLGKPERHEVNSLRKQSRASMNEFTVEYR